MNQARSSCPGTRRLVLAVVTLLGVFGSLYGRICPRGASRRTALTVRLSISALRSEWAFSPDFFHKTGLLCVVSVFGRTIRRHVWQRHLVPSGVCGEQKLVCESLYLLIGVKPLNV